MLRRCTWLVKNLNSSYENNRVIVRWRFRMALLWHLILRYATLGKRFPLYHAQTCISQECLRRIIFYVLIHASVYRDVVAIAILRFAAYRRNKRRRRRLNIPVFYIRQKIFVYIKNIPYYNIFKPSLEKSLHPSLTSLSRSNCDCDYLISRIPYHT